MIIEKMILSLHYTKHNNMKAIINRKEKFGTLNGIITKNEEILRVVYQHLKQGTAKLLVDTEDTLMYNLLAKKSTKI